MKVATAGIDRGDQRGFERLEVGHPLIQLHKLLASTSLQASGPSARETGLDQRGHLAEREAQPLASLDASESRDRLLVVQPMPGRCRQASGAHERPSSVER